MQKNSFCYLKKPRKIYGKCKMICNQLKMNYSFSWRSMTGESNDQIIMVKITILAEERFWKLCAAHVSFRLSLREMNWVILLHKCILHFLPCQWSPPEKRKLNSLRCTWPIAERIAHWEDSSALNHFHYVV